MSLFEKIFGSLSEKELKKIRPIADKVMALEEKYKEYTKEQLQECTALFKERLANGETLDDILPEAFAVCREASSRVLNMRHFYVQIIGGIVLHNANIAEMKTGEGKTLVATLPVYLNALTGKGVHVITVNDYLARRDSEWMGELYTYLGLSVGLIINGVEPVDRKAAYDCDITYGTNNEFGFDYLRDNMATYKEKCVQRNHYYAIVDEVDSILVDEARTPLIISGRGDKSTDLYKLADNFAKTLRVYKIKEENSKIDYNDPNSEDYIDTDCILDEKHRNATLTPAGTEKAEKFFKVDNLSDGDNMEIMHHINQALKARNVMKKDVDYVVRDGEVIIVDEFTGRLMIGRRYNEGLHQAIEAKENVKVAHESKTLATITFQNYFRMYEKLAGMTGTAMTEADEFSEIYDLEVIEIPTNKPIARKDLNDQIYKNINAKYNAIVKRVIECHEKGQPVLVGTVNIEKSEILSQMLKRHGIKHEVLNAKFHDKEAEIVAQAGKFGAVTIATNMAGRGTDIVLGGNASHLAKNTLLKEGCPEELIADADSFASTDNEELAKWRARYAELLKEYQANMADEAEKVRNAGGLCILGTERHESRRIDNQLRGRAGRQGDEGETQFYLSLEDDLMRLFGGERIQSVMETLRVEEDMPIENKLITNSIESSQKKIEGRNFQIRKNVLQYDNIMNSQRSTIYDQRKTVLDGQDLRDNIENMFTDSITGVVNTFLTGEEKEFWNFDSLRQHYLGWLAGSDDFKYTDEELANVTAESTIELLVTRAKDVCAKKEKEYGSERMRDVERMILLRSVDTHWMEHIDNMDQLRRGMGMRSYAQHDPVTEYRIEGFEMFDEMIDSIKADVTKNMMTFRLRENASIERKQVAQVTSMTASTDEPPKKQPVKVGVKVGRNDPCPCGSGKKYKHCCYGKDHAKKEL